MKHALFILLILFPVSCQCQEMVYANTDNIVLRDRPEKRYNVFAILKKGCPVRIEPYQFAEKDVAVKRAFYHVSINYSVGTYHHHIIGWVIKKYLSKGTDTFPKPANEYFEQIVPVCDFNGADYPPPKYKGAEAQPQKAAREYHKGPRGGCYYMNDKGHKVYVDKQYCEEAGKRKK